jgi:sarcosine oxidase subunit beta
VITDQGEIATRVAVNVAGPWGAEIGAMAGVAIPIFASRHPVIILHRPPSWRTPTPIWFDMVRGFYYKPEHGAGFMAGTLDEATHHAAVDTEAHATVPEYSEVETLSDATMKRFPVMESGTAQGGWAGLYDVTPDSQPVIDRIDQVEGFFCAVGFSGHGFKLAPAVGVIMSDLILTGRTAAYDIDCFRYARFREGRAGKPAYEYSVIG